MEKIVIYIIGVFLLLVIQFYFLRRNSKKIKSRHLLDELEFIDGLKYMMVYNDSNLKPSEYGELADVMLDIPKKATEKNQTIKNHAPPTKQGQETNQNKSSGIQNEKGKGSKKGTEKAQEYIENFIEYFN